MMYGEDISQASEIKNLHEDMAFGIFFKAALTSKNITSSQAVCRNQTLCIHNRQWYAKIKLAERCTEEFAFLSSGVARKHPNKAQHRGPSQEAAPPSLLDPSDMSFIR